MHARLDADNEGNDILRLTIPEGLNTTVNSRKLRLTPDPKIMFESEEEYVQAMSKSIKQRTVNKPVAVTKHKRGRSVVRKHRRILRKQK